MVKSATDRPIDLAASSRRLAAARDIAERQARLVEAAGSTVDRLNVDLLFLTQETVLVLDETHRMLAALSARDDALDRDLLADVMTRRRAPPSRRLVLALQAIALAIVAVFAIEIIDPAPMDIFAFHANVPVLGP